MTRDEIIEMAVEVGVVERDGCGLFVCSTEVSELVEFAALVAAKALGEPVGRVTGDGAVTWLAPIPEEGADLYGGPCRARGQQ